VPHIHFEAGRGQRVPVYLWARAVSDETVAQLERIASRPYVVLRVASMADAHVGSGSVGRVAVGTVFATGDVVVPRALGGDLGCGVSALRLGPVPIALDKQRLEPVVAALVRGIPAGRALQRAGELPDDLRAAALSTHALEHARDALGGKHLGTLGEGNHFLELDRDAEGNLWLLVHSGSRGLGAAIAHHHVRVAESLDADPLAGIPADSSAGRAYLDDLAWALAFARANRAALAARALAILRDVLGVDFHVEDTIDIPHNFVARERWDDRDVVVHRKGAVAVPAGTRAIVPGSMATASYIVTGRGNALAFDSCSHGAGRVMSRKEAHARVKTGMLGDAMRRIAWPKHLEKKLVEESPHVYRDIGEVLDDQDDLVTRGPRLVPLAVLKG